jgi:hypothetical protein
MCTSANKKIKSIGDYLQLIRTREKGKRSRQKTYYRGENRDYKESKLVSSYIRELKPKIEGTLEDIGKFNLMDLLEEYYYEVASYVGTDEKDNFVPFSQHHGLPTNLLDLTTNPLVALWFACQNKEDDGCVYLFDGYKFIKMDDDILKDCSKSAFNVSDSLENMKEYLFGRGDECKKSIAIISWFARFGIERSKDQRCLDLNFWEKKLSKYIADNYPEIKKDDDNNAYKIFNSIPKKEFNEHSYCQLYENKDFQKMAATYKTNEDNKLRRNRITLVILAYYCMKYVSKNDKFMPLPLPIFKPSIKFDRMRNQAGLFAIQSYGEFGGKILHQELIPDETVKINKEDKKAILDELSKIGIDEAFIYGDVDSIARKTKTDFFEFERR